MVVRVPLGVTAIALALAIVAVSTAAVTTTAPSTRITVLVRVGDKGISTPATYQWQGSDTLVPLPPGSAVPRGDFATFNVVNYGKKPHNFTILGRKTPTIRPGRRASFNVLLKRRGNFTYSSTLDKGKAFRGVFSVI
jgi:hypothetical protein